MHITLESDYAIRIVHSLSKEKRRMDAKEISGLTNVTLRFSLKILRKLVAAGVVRSFKGTLGGYELAREPFNISLNDVIEAVEGPYMLSRCLCPEYDCTHSDKDMCRFSRVFEEISGEVHKRLKDVNFG